MPCHHPHPLLIAWLRVLALAAGCLALLIGAAGAQAPVAPAPRHAVVLEIDGAIGPATVDHVRRGLRVAQERGAVALVLRVDTPGGLDVSMREIVRAILASPVPVLGHVAPSGARAASAGTYILYATHVAAMAPGTAIGAATPVQLGGGGEMPGRPASSPASGARTGGSVAEAKATNDAVAYIRALAELRQRNAGWAERAVRESVSLPAHEAVAQRVVDLLVDGTAALLAQADGRVVRLGAGDVTLRTTGASLHHVEPDWRTRLLGVITNPNIALLLMMIGVYGLLFEFMNPGAAVPGVLGAISLLLGLYALSALPLGHAGIALLVLGVGLIVAEAFAPSFGILGIGGVVAMVIGAGLLVDTEGAGFAPSLPFVAALGLAGLAVTLLTVRLALRARHRPRLSGADGLPGAPATVLDWDAGQGHVHLAGERWRARGPSGLLRGQQVVVRAVEGLVVEVGMPPAARYPPTASGVPP